MNAVLELIQNPYLRRGVQGVATSCTEAGSTGTRAVVRRLGLQALTLCVQDLKRVLSLFDYDGDGNVQYRELLAMVGPSAHVYAANTR